jgi:hypothetical protein
LEFRDFFPGVSADPEYKSSFQWRLLNQGVDGFYTLDGNVVPGKIFDPSGEEIRSDILLDRLGRPLDTNYTVEGQTSQSNPFLPSGAEFDIQDSAIYVLYRRYASKNFAGLNLG